MSKKITAQECCKLISEALKTFGTYSYEDKGANEVMDIPEIVGRIKELPDEEIVALLKEVEKKHKNPHQFLCAVVMSFQDWGDRFDKLFEIDEEFLGEYY